MNASNLPLFNSSLDWDEIPMGGIQLQSAQIDQALDQARRVQAPDQLWQRYLYGLARFGFEQWIQARSPESLPVIDDNSSESFLLIVNGFRICLLPQASQLEEEIAIPKSVIEAQANGAHFYVVVAIAEEQGIVEMNAVLRQDELIPRCASLTLDADNTYGVPLDWFEPDAERLLLFLRCSEPAAFASVSTVESKPELHARMAEASENISQAAMNTALWLEGQLDTLAQQLAWVLLPPPQLEYAFRATSSGLATPISEDAAFQRLLGELLQRGVQIPERPRAAYQELAIANQSVRLYALIGEVSAEITATQEWSLILILGPSASQSLPGDIRLGIHSPEAQIADIPLGAGAAYLFAEVIGEMDEAFGVTISLGARQVVTLPPFAFRLSAS